MIRMNLDEHLARDVGRVIIHKLKICASDRINISILDCNNIVVTVDRSDFLDNPPVYNKNTSVTEILINNK